MKKLPLSNDRKTVVWRERCLIRTAISSLITSSTGWSLENFTLSEPLLHFSRMFWNMTITWSWKRKKWKKCKRLTIKKGEAKFLQNIFEIQSEGHTTTQETEYLMDIPRKMPEKCLQNFEKLHFAAIGIDVTARVIILVYKRYD